MNWKGVLPAVTTNLKTDLSVDHDAFAAHCRWMIDSGCTGIVCGGSLGEAQTLSFDEKIAIVRTAVAAVGARAPVRALADEFGATAERLTLAAQANNLLRGLPAAVTGRAVVGAGRDEGPAPGLRGAQGSNTEDVGCGG